MSNTDTPRIQNSQMFLLYETPQAVASKTSAGISGEFTHWTNLDSSGSGMGHLIRAVPLNGRRNLPSLAFFTTGADNAECSCGVWAAYRVRKNRGLNDAASTRTWRGQRLGVLSAITFGAAVVPTDSAYDYYRGDQASGTTLRYADAMTWTADEYLSQHMSDIYTTAAHVYDATQNGGNANEIAEFAITDLGDIEALVFDIYDADGDSTLVNAEINLGY